MSARHHAASSPVAEASALSAFARAKLPTRWGVFEVVSFANVAGEPVEHVAIVHGDVTDGRSVPTRIHSECLTGDVFGSLRCDCRDQLDLAISRVADGHRGVVLYLRQEGRGIGIAHKIRAYELQDEGLDTAEANLRLGFAEDLRRYGIAAQMLKAMGIRSVELHTNNARKLEGLEQGGVEIVRRVPIVGPERPENARYLATKRSKFGHLL